MPLSIRYGFLDRFRMILSGARLCSVRESNVYLSTGSLKEVLVKLTINDILDSDKGYNFTYHLGRCLL